MTESEYIIGGLTIGAGTYRHATSLMWLWTDNGYSGTLTNNGTIWWAPTSDNWTFTAANVGTFVNTGKLVLTSSGYNTDIQAIWFVNSVQNSGDVFAILNQGDVQALHSDYGGVTVTNSGLIAAQTGDGLTQTLFMRYGGTVNNQAGGEILAEGPNAVAILFRDARTNSQINNAGLIEANSTDPNIASVAIYVGQLGVIPGQTVQVTNSGIIRGDYAMVSDDDLAATQTQMSVEVVLNQAGGLIEGVIALNRGNDRIDNDGTIRGDVLLGEGNDIFDTVGGTFEGVADLGWGNDQFLGSAGMDRVAGDDGNDSINGNGGNDLLLGGGNDDTLIGGAGNDGLFGEYGNDRIVTSGGDYADGGAGDDRLELGDYSFAFANGGEGFDTLVLPGPAGVRTINLASVLAEGAVADFEQIELTGGKSLIVQPSDITALTGGETTLRLTTTLTDRVKLVGAWTNQGSQTIDGVVWKTYASGGMTVLVQGTGTVSTNAVSEAGPLDPFAGGELPPLPGVDSGLDFTSNDFFLYDYELTQSVTVNPEEIWWNDGFQPVLTDDNNYDITLTNFGWIFSYSEWEYPFTRTIEAHNLEHLVNHGVISAISTGLSGSQDSNFTETVVSAKDVVNHGVIEAQAVYGNAIALSFYSGFGPLENDGDILASSENGMAVAVRGVSTFSNHGTIVAHGATSAVGVELTWNAYENQANDGYIEAATFGSDAQDSLGIYCGVQMMDLSTSFTNNGAIVADIALMFAVNSLQNGAVYTIINNGELHGGVVLGQIGDRFVNNGLITGVTNLGLGDDRFDGSAGTQGEVQGGEGNDELIGGAGQDMLQGGAGVDTLTGGSGNDLFKDSAAGLSGDTITDFAAGDTIVITDATLAGFSFSLSGGTLTFTGGSVTLSAPPAGQIYASAAIGGGVQLSFTPPALPDAVRNDFNGDGRSDILWRSDGGQFSDWLANENGGFAGNDGNAFASVPTSWHIAGTGDFNGDGKADVLWRSDSGQVSDWLGQANGGFTTNDGNALTTVPTNWHIVGTGDFNGDHKDDILWRSDTGQLSNWLGQANGGFSNNDTNAFANVPTDWHVAGTGDFNGDGRDDILWRNDSGLLSDWLGTEGGGFVTNDANAFAAAPTSWHVVGTGDFNGDGRDDILWRSDTGQLSNWLGQENGGFVGNDANAMSNVPTSWQVAAVGDYNGDGFDDILWRSDSGQLSNWLGTESGGFANNDGNALTSAPISWHVQPEHPWI